MDRTDLDDGEEDDAEWDIESPAEHQSRPGGAQPENTRPDGVMMMIMSLLKEYVLVSRTSERTQS